MIVIVMGNNIEWLVCFFCHVLVGWLVGFSGGWSVDYCELLDVSPAAGEGAVILERPARLDLLWSRLFARSESAWAAILLT